MGFSPKCILVLPTLLCFSIVDDVAAKGKLKYSLRVDHSPERPQKAPPKIFRHEVLHEVVYELPPDFVPQDLSPQAPQRLPPKVPQQFHSETSQQLPSNDPQNLPSELPDDYSLDEGPQGLSPELSPQLSPASPINVPHGAAYKPPSEVPREPPPEVPHKFPSGVLHEYPPEVPHEVPSEVPQEPPLEVPDVPPPEVDHEPSFEVPHDNVPDIPPEVPEEQSNEVPHKLSPNQFISQGPGDFQKFSHNLPDDSSDEPLRNPPRDTPQELQPEVPQDLTPEVPHELPDSNKIPYGALHGFHYGDSSKMPPKISNELPPEAPSEFPQKNPLEVSHELPLKVPSESPNDPQDYEGPLDLPSGIPHDFPQDLSPDVSHELPPEVARDLSPAVPPNELPPEMSQDFPPKVPEVPHDFSSEVPQQFPPDVPSEFLSELPRNGPRGSSLQVSQKLPHEGLSELKGTAPQMLPDKHIDPPNDMPHGVSNKNPRGSSQKAAPARNESPQVKKVSQEHTTILPPWLLGQQFAHDIIEPTGEPKKTQYWPNGEVPYKVSPAYNEHEKATIMEAINAITSATCVKIRPFVEGDQYGIVYENNNASCSSRVGFWNTWQTVSLDPHKNCLSSVGVPIHETLHALGFYHEHQYKHRDEYVTIHWENIKPGFKREFDIVNEYDDLSFEYDYHSILHFGESYFSSNGKPTITSKNSNSTILQYPTKLTENDIKRINRTYNCTA